MIVCFLCTACLCVSEFVIFYVRIYSVYLFSTSLEMKLQQFRFDLISVIRDGNPDLNSTELQGQTWSRYINTTDTE